MSIFEILFNLLCLAWGLSFVGQALIDTYVYMQRQLRLLEKSKKDENSIHRH